MAEASVEDAKGYGKYLGVLILGEPVSHLYMLNAGLTQHIETKPQLPLLGCYLLWKQPQIDRGLLLFSPYLPLCSTYPEFYTETSCQFPWQQCCIGYGGVCNFAWNNLPACTTLTVLLQQRKMWYFAKLLNFLLADDHYRKHGFSLRERWKRMYDVTGCFFGFKLCVIKEFWKVFGSIDLSYGLCMLHVDCKVALTKDIPWFKNAK